MQSWQFLSAFLKSGNGSKLCLLAALSTVFLLSSSEIALGGETFDCNPGDPVTGSGGYCSGASSWFCANCPCGYRANLWSTPVLAEEVECFYWGNAEDVNTSIPGTEVQFSNIGSGACDLPSSLNVPTCGFSDTWEIRCDGGGRPRLTVSNNKSGVWLKTNICCRPKGDTARCRNRQPGLCPNGACNIGCGV